MNAVRPWPSRSLSVSVPLNRIAMLGICHDLEYRSKYGGLVCLQENYLIQLQKSIWAWAQNGSDAPLRGSLITTMSEE